MSLSQKAQRRSSKIRLQSFFSDEDPIIFAFNRHAGHFDHDIVDLEVKLLITDLLHPALRVDKAPILHHEAHWPTLFRMGAH